MAQSPCHDDMALFTKFFGKRRYESKLWYGGASKDKDGYSLNHFQLFCVGGYQFLHLNLRDVKKDDKAEPMDYKWAQYILDRYPNTPTILSTHIYLGVAEENGSPDKVADDAKEIWTKLVCHNSQIFLTLNGHVSKGLNAPLCSGRSVACRKDGTRVLQMMFDSQGSNAEENNHGDGWLRKIIFDRENKRITAQTYSVTHNKYYKGKSNGNEFEKCDHYHYFYNADFSDRHIRVNENTPHDAP